jgi:hypothetical protein
MLSSDIDTTLRSNGYRCRISPYDASMLLFEDEAIFGFVVLFEDANQLLESWKAKQTLFIQRNASALRRAHMKSWNCYSVYLSSQPASAAMKPLLAEIEEDLALTRKIVGDGVSTQRDIQRALLPILPIQNHAVTASAAKVDLGSRLHGWSPSALHALEGATTAEDLLDILWDAS